MVNLIKRYLLFLLILFCVSSVSAMTLPDPSAYSDPTEYYIQIDDYTESMIISTLSTRAYTNNEPSIVRIEDEYIYFATQNDLGRFLLQPSYVDTSVAFNDMDIYIGGKRYIYTEYYNYVTRKGSGTTYEYFNITLENPSYIYYASYYSGYTSGLSINGVSAANTFKTTVLSGNIPCYGYATGSGETGTGYGKSTIAILEYAGLEDPLGHVEILVLPPDKGDIMIYTETGTEVYDGTCLLGTTDNSGLLAVSLPIGDYDLKFVKEGYWDVIESVTINAENETELFVSLPVKNAIFQVSKEFSGNIYPNSIAALSMDISPIRDAYATKLRISGIDVNKVSYKAQEIPKSSDGSYILGDISSVQYIEIEFKTPSSWGEKTFTVELDAVDLEGTAYTNLETINYEVLELPFLLEMPETFGIGLNDITLTDMSGTAYSVLLVLYDSEGTEKWSSSTNLLEYCEYTFEVPIDDAGDYTLELNAKAGTVKTYYSIEIIEPVTLITKELTVNPGKIGTVQFKISNPTSNVKYYTASLTCPFLDGSVNKTFSISPGTVDKTVDISFEVPKGLELENYQLVLKIYDPDRTDPIYSGNVVLTISNESLIFASVPGGNTTIILLAAAILLIMGTFAALRLKK